MFYYSAMLYNVHKHGKKRPLVLFDPCANLFRKQKDIEIRSAHCKDKNQLLYKLHSNLRGFF